MSTLKNATPEEILNALDQSQERVVVNVISGKPMSRAEEHYHKASDQCYKDNKGNLKIDKLSPQDCKRIRISKEYNDKLYDEAAGRQFIICSLKGAQRSEGGVSRDRKVLHSFCSRIKDSGKSGHKIKSRAKKSA
jgi:hypothetical protein